MYVDTRFMSYCYTDDTLYDLSVASICCQRRGVMDDSKCPIPVTTLERDPVLTPPPTPEFVLFIYFLFLFI